MGIRVGYLHGVEGRADAETTDLDEGQHPSRRPRHLRVSREGWYQLWDVAGRLFSDVDEQVRARLHVSEREDDPHPLQRAATLRDGLSALVDLQEREGDMSNWEQLTHSGELRAFYFVVDERGVQQPDLTGLAEEFGADTGSSPAEIEDAILDAIKELSVGSTRVEWWYRELNPLFEYLSLEGFADIDTLLVVRKSRGWNSPQALRHGGLATRIADELPLIARRLVGEEQELYLEIDRMQGEISFRFALALPVALTTTVLALGLSLPWWATVGVVIAGWVAGVALLADGWRRDRLRNDLLVSLLAIDKAKSPTFERLIARAMAIEKRDERALAEAAEVETTAS
jgi:hypothetical protein